MTSLDSVHGRLERLQELQTIPATVKALIEVIDNPRLSFSEIAAVVSRDPVLAAHLLKTVNSAYFGFSGRISSITQALLLLGLQAAKGILLGVSVFRSARGMEGLWAHSIGAAVVAGMFAEERGIEDSGDLFVAGLLHDVGKVFLNLKFPKEYHEVLSVVLKKGWLPVHAEEDVFHTDHARVAAWLLERWHLPDRLIEPIRYHHEPSMVTQRPTETAIIHLADVLTHARWLGSGGTSLVPLIDPSVRARLRLSTNTIVNILSTSDNAVQEGIGFLWRV